MPELGAWVKRQRVARQQAGLTQERLAILVELGFEFGEEAQMTEEWEWRFDSLVELLLMRVRSPCFTSILYTSFRLTHHGTMDQSSFFPVSLSRVLKMKSSCTQCQGTSGSRS
jgi:hypothetical protein